MRTSPCPWVLPTDKAHLCNDQITYLGAKNYCTNSMEKIITLGTLSDLEFIYKVKNSPGENTMIMQFNDSN